MVLHKKTLVNNSDLTKISSHETVISELYNSICS